MWIRMTLDRDNRCTVSRSNTLAQLPHIGLAFTRRYGRFISNSVRVVGNAGQEASNSSDVAVGLLLLLESSLLTSQSSSLVPYFNLWAGFERSQSVARAQQASGILSHPGILFESDGMPNVKHGAVRLTTPGGRLGGVFSLRIMISN